MIHKVHIDIYMANYRLGTQLFSHQVDTRIVTEESIECKTIKSKLHYFSFYLVFFIWFFRLFLRKFFRMRAFSCCCWPLASERWFCILFHLILCAHLLSHWYPVNREWEKRVWEKKRERERVLGVSYHKKLTSNQLSEIFIDRLWTGTIDNSEIKNDGNSKFVM